MQGLGTIHVGFEAAPARIGRSFALPVAACDDKRFFRWLRPLPIFMVFQRRQIIGMSGYIGHIGLSHWLVLSARLMP